MNRSSQANLMAAKTIVETPFPPKNGFPRVCLITTVHEARDDRIFHKQALSLAQAGYDVALIAPWDAETEAGPVGTLAKGNRLNRR